MSGSYEMLKIYNPVRRYPSHVIIDKAGNISYILEGSSKEIDTLLDAEIEKVI
ncbi:hypothetical protein [Lutibacter flavus]|uniref:hypothetical protein n=1 Tax=Lutibacter flavus TaxID=691689 RepID=UPI001595DF0A|nr:hypothetical protein [Lutibacter flavus]